MEYTAVVIYVHIYLLHAIKHFSQHTGGSYWRGGSSHCKLVTTVGYTEGHIVGSHLD